MTTLSEATSWLTQTWLTPTVEDIATIYDKGLGDGRLAKDVREAGTFTVERLGSDTHRSDLGYADRASRTVAAATVRWSTPAHDKALTIIDLTSGGLSDGEGWAMMELVLVEAPVSAEQLGMILRLAADRVLPSAHIRREL